MESKWITRPLEDCIAALLDYRGKTPEKTGAGIPLITAKVIKGGRINTPNEFIAAEDYDSWMRRGIPAAGDIVITTEAPLGEVAQLGSERVALAQRLITLRGKPEILDNDFLKFLMQSDDIQSQLRARATGTTVLGIKQSELRKILLTLPPIREQRAIAHVLSTLDDKIELNRRMSATLEEMARTLFESWFVRFDPVRSKIEGRAIELPSHIADLFPEKLEESVIGEIPHGWQCLPLPEAFDVNPVRSLGREEVAPYLDMANMPTDSYAPITWASRAYGSGMRFIKGDTLVARITPCLENGKTAFVDFLEDGEVGWGSTEYIVLRPKAPLPLIFAYCLARNERLRSFMIGQMSGSSGRQRVPTSSLAHFMVAIPPEAVASIYGNLVQPMFERSKILMDETRSLFAIRDSLLPKLISGELRIPFN